MFEKRVIKFKEMKKNSIGISCFENNIATEI